MIDPTCLKTIRVPKSSLNDCCFMANGTKVITCGSDGNVHTHETMGTYRINSYGKRPKAVTSVVYSIPEKLIYAGDYDGRIFKMPDSVQVKPEIIRGHSSQINSITISPNNELLLTASNDKTAKLFDIKRFTYFSSLVGHSYSLTQAVFSPTDEKVVMTTSLDKTSRLWDLKSKLEISTTTHQVPATCCDFHSDGTMIAVALQDGSFSLKDLRNNQVIQVYPNAHSAEITSIHFHQSGGFALTTSADRLVKIWDLMEGQLFFALNTHQAPVTNGCWDGDGSHFLTCDKNGYTILWQTNFDKLLKKLNLEQSQ